MSSGALVSCHLWFVTRGLQLTDSFVVGNVHTLITRFLNMPVVNVGTALNLFDALKQSLRI